MTRLRQRGFSLIELLIVVAIMIVIAAIAIPNLLRARQNAYEVGAVGFLHTLQTAQIAYRTSNGGYARSFDDLPELRGTGTTTTTSSDQGQTPSPSDQNQDPGNRASSNSQSGGSSSTTTTVRSHYIFTLITTGSDQWNCTAQPTLDRITGRYFFTDESGAIRYTTGRAASSTSPVVQ